MCECVELLLFDVGAASVTLSVVFVWAENVETEVVEAEIVDEEDMDDVAELLSVTEVLPRLAASMVSKGNGFREVVRSVVQQ